MSANTLIDKKDKKALADYFQDKQGSREAEEALKYALFENNEDMVEYLVTLGISIHTGEEYVLRHACAKGLIRTVKFAVNQGASIHHLRNQSLAYAFQNNQFEVIDYLLKQDKSLIHMPEIMEKEVKSPESYQYAKDKQFLVRNVDTVLKNMVRNNIKEGVDDMLMKGAQIDKGSPNALEVAISNRHEDMVFYLIEKGASIHLPENRIFHKLCKAGMVTAVKYCIEQGVLKNSTTYDIVKATVIGNSLSVLKCLIENGLPFRENNEVALRRAVENDNLEIMDYLISMGADIQVNNGFLLRKAIENRSEDMVTRLIELGIVKTEEALQAARNNQMIDFVQQVFKVKEMFDMLSDLPKKEQPSKKLKV